jgi:hypothetical protein
MAFVYPRSGAHALDERSTMQDAVPTATLATGDVDLASTLATVAFLPDDPTVRLGPARSPGRRRRRTARRASA